MVETIARRSWIDGEGVFHKNDLYAVDGTFAVVSGADAYAQAVESAVETVRGELPLDTARGIPYFSTVFASRRNVAEWAAAVRAEVKALPFVNGIVSFDYEMSDGKLSYRLEFSTDEGVGVAEATISAT